MLSPDRPTTRHEWKRCLVSASHQAYRAMNELVQLACIRPGATVAAAVYAVFDTAVGVVKAGLSIGFPSADQYVEIELAGGDPAERFPGTACTSKPARDCTPTWRTWNGLHGDPGHDDRQRRRGSCRSRCGWTGGSRRERAAIDAQRVQRKPIGSFRSLSTWRLAARLSRTDGPPQSYRQTAARPHLEQAAA
jgi:hypothetical protein